MRSNARLMREQPFTEEDEDRLLGVMSDLAAVLAGEPLITTAVGALVCHVVKAFDSRDKAERFRKDLNTVIQRVLNQAFPLN